MQLIVHRDALFHIFNINIKGGNCLRWQHQYRESYAMAHLQADLIRSLTVPKSVPYY